MITSINEFKKIFETKINSVNDLIENKTYTIYSTIGNGLIMIKYVGFFNGLYKFTNDSGKIYNFTKGQVLNKIHLKKSSVFESYNMMSFTVPNEFIKIDEDKFGIKFGDKTYIIRDKDLSDFENNKGNTVQFKYFKNANPMYMEMVKFI